eukprot:scaffold2368_cov248-Pinguiococcus_pyrenoidosus.AAC.7
MKHQVPGVRARAGGRPGQYVSFRTRLAAFAQRQHVSAPPPGALPRGGSCGRLQGAPPEGRDLDRERPLPPATGQLRHRSAPSLQSRCRSTSVSGWLGCPETTSRAFASEAARGTIPHASARPPQGRRPWKLRR